MYAFHSTYVVFALQMCREIMVGKVTGWGLVDLSLIPDKYRRFVLVIAPQSSCGYYRV
jgi:hypothetical protein